MISVTRASYQERFTLDRTKHYLSLIKGLGAMGVLVVGMFCHYLKGLVASGS